MLLTWNFWIKLYYGGFPVKISVLFQILHAYIISKICCVNDLATYFSSFPHLFCCSLTWHTDCWNCLKTLFHIILYFDLNTTWEHLLFCDSYKNVKMLFQMINRIRSVKMLLSPSIPRSGLVIFLCVVRQVRLAGFISGALCSHHLPWERAACIEPGWISYAMIKNVAQALPLSTFDSFCS